MEEVSYISCFQVRHSFVCCLYHMYVDIICVIYCMFCSFYCSASKLIHISRLVTMGKSMVSGSY